jgi:malonyl CoA-acyl carrier protein transacylase
MGQTATLFPGQGSQPPEMRDTVATLRPPAEVTQIMGQDPVDLEVGPGRVLTGLPKRTRSDEELVRV